MPAQKNWISNANVYGLLARLWIAEIDESTLKQLCDGELRNAWEELGGSIPDGETVEKIIDDLAIEYCGCFLGPKGHLPPHQSVVSHSRFQGDCLSSVGKFVDVIGLPDGELFQQQKMRDHAGVLLALMQRVCEAGANSDAAEIDSIVELQAHYFQAHLTWLRDYCEVAVAKTDSTFYQGLFNVTREFLASDSA